VRLLFQLEFRVTLIIFIQVYDCAHTAPVLYFLPPSSKGGYACVSDQLSGSEFDHHLYANGRELSQSQRLGAFDKFKSGSCSILVATDLASRFVGFFLNEKICIELSL
jgi:hypothetical protein